jgi:hypothetical protein
VGRETFAAHAVQITTKQHSDLLFVCTDECCSSTEFVYSSTSPAITYDAYSGADVVVWADHHPGRWLESGPELLVSTVHPDGVLAAPVSLTANGPALSMTAPAITCEPFEVGDFDCMVAYVDASNGEGEIHLARFYVHNGEIFRDVPVPVNLFARTAADPALWIADGYFWLAYKDNLAGQPVVVWRAQTGSWPPSFVRVGEASSSIVGPTTFTGNDGPLLLTNPSVP